MYVVNFFDSDAAADYRRQVEQHRAVSRQRYHDYLAATFDMHGYDDPNTLADVALDALTEWRDVDDGQRCPCSCHPRLPESDFHDYGFGCTCAKTTEDRRRFWDRWRSELDAFWQSPEGQQIRAAEHADEEELQAWLAAQQGVTVRSHGGLAPEQWRGEIDGHSFYFRERHGEWRIELDLAPSGHFATAVTGVDENGEMRCEPRELDAGEVIAEGVAGADGYGTTPVERARFIVDTVRTHLGQQTCTVHTADLSALATLLGGDVQWCPNCGRRLSAGRA
ncbi:hypothetical protein KIH27_17975 [Mycobacterium sp. M1]|uniref:Uncharacterized protein n=1 Tax=Mycolicibacter acidiphilus TaxID=2835306 RepID=A0ABS5RMF0_9MYCO|nr:hypothetical protein [Mycolicibacter acidiphilus]